MATSQLDLIELLQALDPDAPLAQRHLWLIRLLQWLRADTDNPELVVARVRMLLDAAEVRPDWLARWHAWWATFLTTVDATPLLADLGFAPRGALPSEVLHRLRRKLLPRTPETTDLAELFPLLFPSELDASWLRLLDGRTLERLRTVLFGHDRQSPDDTLDTLLDAIAFAISQVSAIGQLPEIRTRMSLDVARQRRFEELPMVFETLRQAVLQHGRLSEPARAALERLRAQLDASRQAAATVYAHLQDHGISVDIEFQLRQLRQRILRVKALLLCLETDAPAQATAQLLSHLVRVNRDSASLRSLLRSSTQLLAARVTERNAETGEHYITRTPREWVGMLGAAAGGGAVLAATTLVKLSLGLLGLSAFWGGLAAGVNYALSFVFIMLLHWAVATKQPAMTAPAMAARLKEANSHAGVENFVDETVYLLRSQFVAVLGNVGMVMPVAILLALLLGAVGVPPVLDARHAQSVLSKHHLLGPTAALAAATGLLLFLSSLIAGWVENWFVFHRLDSVIEHHPRVGAALGPARARRWAHYWREHISGYAANISLGLMLGLTPPVLGFFGVPFEVRHVTLVAGQIALAALQLGREALHGSALWWAVGGMAITGLVNVASSFALAFRLALAAQNVTGVDRRRIYAALGRRVLLQPLSFVLPLRVQQQPPQPRDAAP